MVETVHAAPGIGLAAPQVGVSKRVIVVDLSVGEDADALHRPRQPGDRRQGRRIHLRGRLPLGPRDPGEGRPALPGQGPRPRPRGPPGRGRGRGPSRPGPLPRDRPPRRHPLRREALGPETEPHQEEVQEGRRGREEGMKIVFFGSPAAALPSLEALLAAGHTVELVVTQPDKPAGRGRRLVPSAVKAFAVGTAASPSSSRRRSGRTRPPASGSARPGPTSTSSSPTDRSSPTPSTSSPAAIP